MVRTDKKRTFWKRE